MNDRDAKLKAAAARHGKPFKCGPRGLPREVFKSCKREFVVVDERPVMREELLPPITEIRRRMRG